MTYKLYSPQSQLTAGAKVQLFSRFIDIPVEVERIPFDQWKSPEYIQKHPLGKVPTLQTPQGCIYQSNSILRHLARKAGKFYGNNVVETAIIDQWLEFYNTQLSSNHLNIFYGILGYGAVTKETYEEGKKGYLDHLKIVNAQLKKTSYLGGNQISIADIALFPSIRLALRLFIHEKSRASIPHVVQWHARLFSHKEVTDFFGQPWLCTQQALPEFEVHEKHEEKKEEKKKEKGQKKKEEGKKKQQPKKKQEPKKKEQKKKKKESDNQEQQQSHKQKKVNPLDLLPKSPFNIDDWKRQFCNSPDKQATLHQLWGKFDHDGWSLWKVQYIKYAGEGVVGYLTSNLKNGHLRNLDQHFRKYCFAVYGVYGDENNYEIDGIWMWRGTEIPQAWKEHQTYEYFTFTKLDPRDLEVQKLTAEYWLGVNEGDLVQGRKVFDAKWYK